MMSLYLGRLGYSVTTADTTDEAWAEVEAAPAEFAVRGAGRHHGRA